MLGHSSRNTSALFVLRQLEQNSLCPVARNEMAHDWTETKYPLSITSVINVIWQPDSSSEKRVDARPQSPSRWNHVTYAVRACGTYSTSKQLWASIKSFSLGWGRAEGERERERRC